MFELNGEDRKTKPLFKDVFGSTDKEMKYILIDGK